EELHQLRLDVKRMRAFLFLQQGSFKSGHLPDFFDPFEEIFRKAGKIRSAEVSLRLLKRYGIRDTEIKAEMNKIIHKGTTGFIKRTGSFLEKISVGEKESVSDFRDVDIPGIKKNFAKQLRLTSKKFVKKHKSEPLHEVRKTLKNLLYIHTMFDREITDVIRLNTAYINELEQMIGKWHDIDFAISLIGKKGQQGKIRLKLQVKRKKVLSKIYRKAEKFERTVFLGKSLNL
ncbi:MAG TPA: CHAD domain-containing protein, partial [Bacteroidia bacterium]|nr:CHAD domain-containing protein [Bacteroidia bacterium]